MGGGPAMRPHTNRIRVTVHATRLSSTVSLAVGSSSRPLPLRGRSALGHCPSCNCARPLHLQGRWAPCHKLRLFLLAFEPQTCIARAQRYRERRFTRQALSMAAQTLTEQFLLLHQYLRLILPWIRLKSLDFLVELALPPGLICGGDRGV